MSVGWFLLSGLFVAGIWLVAKFAVDRIADRRYARLYREVERKKLRYETWRRVGGMGG